MAHDLIARLVPTSAVVGKHRISIAVQTRLTQNRLSWATTHFLELILLKGTKLGEHGALQKVQAPQYLQAASPCLDGHCHVHHQIPSTCT